jgi:uncharacterized protein YaiI (UPF0178 family)
MSTPAASGPHERAMQIWVDADACPVAIKEILYRAAARVPILTTFVANRPLRTPPSPYIRAIQVPAGFDVADARIVQEAVAGDLVVTADIPLAAEVIARGALALTPRGERYTAANIRELLTMRDFMDQMRASGVDTGGPPPLDQGDRRTFGSELDRILAAARSRTPVPPPSPPSAGSD